MRNCLFFGGVLVVALFTVPANGELRHRADLWPDYYGNVNAGSGGADCGGELTLAGFWVCSGAYDPEGDDLDSSWRVTCSTEDCTATTVCPAGNVVACSGEYAAAADEYGVACYDNGSGVPLGGLENCT